MWTAGCRCASAACVLLSFPCCALCCKGSGMKEVSRCVISPKINSQISIRVNQLPGVASSPACKGRQARNRRTNVEEVCTKRTGSSASSGAAALCCVGSAFVRPLSSLHELPAGLSLNVLSSLLLVEDKVHVHECCECVWKSDVRVCVQGPPSQTQQGAGGGEKHAPGSLAPFLDATRER